MSDISTLHDVVLFVEVARTRNFSAAGRNLGVSNPTLSRRIAAMEERFGVRLFDRTTRRVELTDAGQRYFDRCAHLADEARLAGEALREDAGQPGGHLRLSMPVDLGVYSIGPALHAFAQRHPAITFDLDLSPGRRDLVGEHVDVAFRLGAVTAEQLVVRRIGWVTQPLFAAPSYLEARGHPRAPADLVQHECILLPRPKLEASWQLANGQESAQVAVHGRFATNNVGMMKMLAERGSGIAALQPALVLDALDRGRLQPVLPGWELPRLPLYAVTTSHLLPARVTLLIDFLAARLTL